MYSVFLECQENKPFQNVELIPMKMPHHYFYLFVTTLYG
ncbi:hypothetical protein FM737_003440 [Escherichia marmotae]|nr:hypothetical protein FM737_003440 [Escherichia marmotae]